MKKLGDSHNFGLFVFEEKGYIIKPRSLFWEFLFLSKESSIRNLIEKHSIDLKIPSPFNLAPNLKFKINNGQLHSVEKLKLNNIPESQKFNKVDFENIGSMMALCFWFGIGDLHKENLIHGLNERSELIMFPIDVECIFDQLTHLNQTLLIPTEDVPYSKCGLSFIWDKLINTDNTNKIALLRSFSDCINLLNSIHENILQTLLIELNKKIEKIRVIPRSTKKYYEAIQSNIFDGFFESEIIQMKRGEIPYFYRYPHSSKLYYFHQKDNPKEAGFEIEAFKLPSPVKLEMNNSSHLVKIKTSILSLSHLAEALDLKIMNMKFGKVEILNGLEVISIYEKNDKILFSFN